MAKSTSTNKKTAAKKTNTKATAKKTAPAKKAATPAKKTAAPAKKAATPKKAAPAKKAAAPAKKVATATKATATKKAATAKKAAAPAKKAAVKAVAKKAAAPKKAATPAKKAAAPAKKVATPAKKAAVPAKAAKKVVAAKQTATKAATTKKVETKQPATKKTMKPKKAKAAAKKNVAPKEIAIPKVEIVDAVTKKSDLKKSKPGQIAIRDLDRKSNKKQNTEESIDTFNPTKTSILADVEAPKHGYRYSDEDLNEFKEIILKRLEVARENLNYYQALMARKDESGTDDTDNRFNSMEDGSGVMEREQLSQLAARQMQFIDHLEKALMRIENKTYGVCRVTGKLIDKARLKAVPHATLSMEAKQNRR